MRSPSQRWRLSIVERDAAEARRVRDQLRRRLDRARRAVGDVERDAARRSPGSGRARRPGARPAGRRARSRSRSAAACGPRASPARGGAARPRRARRRSPCGCATRAAARRARGRATTAPRSASWWPVRNFVAEWSDDVAALLERAQVHRRRHRRVADDEAGCAAAASKSGIVSTGFAGASTQTRSAPAGGGPVWSNSTSRRPQRSSSRAARGAEVRALGERDRRAGPRAARARRPSPRPSRRRRAARRRPRARRARARPRRRSGARSARSRRRAARRRRTARSSSGRAAAPCRESTARPRVRLAAMAETHETTAAKLAWLQELREQARARRQREGGRAAARAREAARARAGRAAARPGLVRRARPLRPPPRIPTSADARTRPYGDAVVTGYGDDLRPQGLRLLARTSPSSAARSPRSSRRRSAR